MLVVTSASSVAHIFSFGISRYLDSTSFVTFCLFPRVLSEPCACFGTRRAAGFEVASISWLARSYEAWRCSRDSVPPTSWCCAWLAPEHAKGIPEGDAHCKARCLVPVVSWSEFVPPTDLILLNACEGLRPITLTSPKNSANVVVPHVYSSIEVYTYSILGDPRIIRLHVVFLLYHRQHCSTNGSLEPSRRVHTKMQYE